MQLTNLRFDNQTLRALPVEQVPNSPRQVEPVRQVKGACFSPINPEPVRAPKLVAASTPCVALLGLSAEEVLIKLLQNLFQEQILFLIQSQSLQLVLWPSVLATCAVHRYATPSLFSTLVATKFCQAHKQQHTVIAAINLAISVGN